MAPGNRLEKTVNALFTIGPAVLNGGLTTFLALALGSFSTGHVLNTFFKVFTLTVVFGLYHGLVVFPVILVTMGPLQESQSASSTQGTSTQGTSTKIENIMGKNNLGFEVTDKLSKSSKRGSNDVISS